MGHLLACFYVKNESIASPNSRTTLADITFKLYSSHSSFCSRSRGCSIELRSGGFAFAGDTLGSVGLRALLEACLYSLQIIVEVYAPPGV